MAFVIPDIKEVYEMKKIVKELDPTIQANQLVILKNNLQEALKHTHTLGFPQASPAISPHK